MLFENAVTKILKEEGGYVNDPRDSGGATNRGITQKVYDAWRKKKNLDPQPVKLSTKLEAIEIYEGIWQDCKASELPPGLNLVHFDFAVNAGNRRAAMVLQEILNVRIDGIIGPKTLAAAHEKPVEESIKAYSSRRLIFYQRVVVRKPTNRAFIRGWTLRTNRVEKAALQSISPQLPPAA